MVAEGECCGRMQPVLLKGWQRMPWEAKLPAQQPHNLTPAALQQQQQQTSAQQQHQHQPQLQQQAGQPVSERPSAQPQAQNGQRHNGQPQQANGQQRQNGR